MRLVPSDGQTGSNPQVLINALTGHVKSCLKCPVRRLIGGWPSTPLTLALFRAMVYSPQMSELVPPRSRSVTTAGVLVILTGCIWLALAGSFLWWGFDSAGRPSLRQILILAVLVVLVCMSAGTVIVGFGILFRRNRGRIIAIALAGPWILFGCWFLKPFLRLPASQVPGEIIALYSFPILAAMAWLAILTRKRVRIEFLPLAVVQIYVNLLDEETPCSRPTQALVLGNGLFELLPTEGYNPDAEHWEFHPGSIVRGTEAHRDGETYLLAVSFGS